MKLCASVVLFTLAALCQDGPKKEPKPFTAPELPILTNPLVAKDEGCAKDLAKANNVSGVEQRKQLAELFTYGCIRELPGSYRKNTVEVKTVGEGSSTALMHKVYLIDLSNGKDRTGWILTNQAITVDTLDSVMASLPMQTLEVLFLEFSKDHPELARKIRERQLAERAR